MFFVGFLAPPVVALIRTNCFLSNITIEVINKPDRGTQRIRLLYQARCQSKETHSCSKISTRALADDERVYICAAKRDVLTYSNQRKIVNSLDKRLEADFPSAGKHCIGFGTHDASMISNVTCLGKNSG